MLIVISPAKTLDFESPLTTREGTEPRFLTRSAELVKTARMLDAAELARLMSISPDLASLNHARFAHWSKRHTGTGVRPAVLAFRGDVYQGLQAESFNDEDLAFAQDHLRILSGLYGLLRPLDRIRPYRLEMGSRLVNPRGSNLYQFWGSLLGETLAAELNGRTLVNLASQEYFKAVDCSVLGARVVTPLFKEWRNGTLKIVSFSAKRARGMMARHALLGRLEDAESLKDWREDGYRFEAALSTDNEWVFARKQP